MANQFVSVESLRPTSTLTREDLASIIADQTDIDIYFDEDQDLALVHSRKLIFNHEDDVHVTDQRFFLFNSAQGRVIASSTINYLSNGERERIECLQFIDEEEDPISYDGSNWSGNSIDSILTEQLEGLYVDLQSEGFFEEDKILTEAIQEIYPTQPRELSEREIKTLLDQSQIRSVMNNIVLRRQVIQLNEILSGDQNSPLSQEDSIQILTLLKGDFEGIYYFIENFREFNGGRDLLNLASGEMWINIWQGMRPTILEMLGKFNKLGTVDIYPRDLIEGVGAINTVLIGVESRIPIDILEAYLDSEQLRYLELQEDESLLPLYSETHDSVVLALQAIQLAFERLEERINLQRRDS
jgi:hypothetical protein